MPALASSARPGAQRRTFSKNPTPAIDLQLNLLGNFTDDDNVVSREWKNPKTLLRPSFLRIHYLKILEAAVFEYLTNNHSADSETSKTYTQLKQLVSTQVYVT
ncbi:hypothetical protein TNCV_5097781 [Trichonephila clavipes]|nr:hypothetical protein TNCV_5097781 [Trichonephila clavipes]